MRVFVGFTHTHSSPFRNASAPVSVLCSKLEDNGPIKRVRADEATIFCLVRAVVPGPCGALRWASCVRDFSGLGTWSPAKKIIAGDQVSFLSFFARTGHFVTCTDARENA